LDLRAIRIAPLLDLPFALALLARTIAVLSGLVLVRFAEQTTCARRLWLASLVMHGFDRGPAVKQSSR
jgi:hypothetical protein